MNLKLPGVKLVPVTGTGPNGKVRDHRHPGQAGRDPGRGRRDRRAGQAGRRCTPAVGGVVLLVIVAFLLGRRRGQRKSTWVEIRRL